MTDDQEFTLAEAMAVQAALRRRLNLPRERFPIPSFIGMLSDEIEQLRAAGTTDAQIAKIIADVTGRTIDPEEIDYHYASPEARRR